MRTESSRNLPILIWVSVLLLAGSACATTNVRPEPVVAESLVRRFVLDFEHVPAPPAGVSGPVRQSWEAARAGDAATASQALELAPPGSLEDPGASTVEGFLLLARGAVAPSRARFERAVSADPGFAPALYGLGFLGEATGDRAAGLDWYQRAIDADPTLPAPAIRLQVLQLEQAQALLSEGERAEARGDDRAALSAYESALDLGPDVLETYLRIADIQRRDGRTEDAVVTLRAARDRIGDLRLILEPLGRALQDAGQYADAYDVFRTLEESTPNDPEVRSLVAEARELYFTTSLPEPYRLLEEKAEITREDLAALLAIRLPNLGERVEEPLTGAIILDIEDSWAQDYVRQVVEWGVMEVYQNYDFGSNLPVSRQMFAEVAYRVLDLLEVAEGAPRASLSDVSRDHFFYDQIRVVVGLDILPLGPRNTFGLLDRVSGAEAIAAVQRLVRLARAD
jgi:tetratricopeptide (TPR) repeat protein